jgi:RNA recognition motif. (a.k.a. RRM, RBD, or RNP domain)
LQESHALRVLTDRPWRCAARRRAVGHEGPPTILLLSVCLRRKGTSGPVCGCFCVPLQLLYDTFSAFGVIVATPKIMRDPETGASRGFGFVSYDCFEASDQAIDAMNGQFLCNR